MDSDHDDTGSLLRTEEAPEVEQWQQVVLEGPRAGRRAAVVVAATVALAGFAGLRAARNRSVPSTGAGQTAGLWEDWQQQQQQQNQQNNWQQNQQNNWQQNQQQGDWQPPPRKGSFLVLGDWGYDYPCHGDVPTVTCQQAIADRMLEKMEELGDVKFVINVGDSFYPHGVVSKSDPQWQTKWRNIFPKKLREVPWYSVYGNHDLQHDPCACTTDLEQCAQLNSNISNLDYFYFPDINWHKEHPELDLEVVALELNHYMEGWDQNRPASEQHFDDCKYTDCQEQCLHISKSRAADALKYFHDRASKATAKNLLVFSHYPTDYFHSAPEFLEGLRNTPSRNLLYVGGHRHNVDDTSTTSIEPNKNWVVGGGGGWSCDGPAQGFLVGEVSHDYQMKTYPVLVDEHICCTPGQNNMPQWEGGPSCEWMGCDNCIAMDESACRCRELNPNGPCTKCPNSTSIGRVCSGTSCSPPI